MDTTSWILLAALLVLFTGVTVFFVGIEPLGIVERWIATLANGDPVPENPRLGWRFWLRPVHRECLAAVKKMRNLQVGSDQMQQRLAQVEFLQSFVLGSLIEGVLVVDENRQITLVNSEFLNLFQLSESPLRRSVMEVMQDDKLDALITQAFRSGKVEAGRITRQFNPEGGRPPSFEVSAVPVRVSQSRVGAVVVLFLPPPDRPRIVQVMKRHAEKLERLVNDWTPSGRTMLRSSVADLQDFNGLSKVPARPVESDSQNETGIKSRPDS